MSEDKAIHILYESIGHLLCEQPYGEWGRYLTYYAEDRLYLVFDLWYHGFYLVEAKSPKDAIDKVNCDQLAYLPKKQTMSRYIDADALDKAFSKLRFNNDGELEHYGDRPNWYLWGSEVESLIADAPSIKTKEIKYFDEDEKVWKIGSVIVDEY